jgi:hypothetical protein
LYALFHLSPAAGLEAIEMPEGFFHRVHLHWAGA